MVETVIELMEQLASMTREAQIVFVTEFGMTNKIKSVRRLSVRGEHNEIVDKLILIKLEEAR